MPGEARRAKTVTCPAKFEERRRMPHPERCFRSVQMSFRAPGIFENKEGPSLYIFVSEERKTDFNPFLSGKLMASAKVRLSSSDLTQVANPRSIQYNTPLEQEKLEMQLRKTADLYTQYQCNRFYFE